MVQDETSSWNKPAVVPAWDKEADRPDEAVQAYGLDAETEARVYAEAEAQILTQGGKHGLIPRMHIHRVMADLLAQRQEVPGDTEESAPGAARAA